MAEPSKRRGRGEGSVYQDGNRWVGVADLGIDPATRKRIRRKVSGRTKTEARQRLAELLESARKGTVTRGDLTVADVIRELLEHPPEQWRSPITIAGNTHAAERAIAALGSTKLVRLSVPQVEAWLGRLAAEGYAAGTIAQARSVLRTALRRAERDHGLARNVADLADLPQAPRKASRSITPDEIGELLALDLDPWWRAWVTCAVMLGLRPGELLGLTWACVDLKAEPGTVKVRHSLKEAGGQLVLADLKTKSSRRTLQMPADVVTALKAHRAAQAEQKLALGPAYADDGYVFADAAGGPSSRFYVRRRFRALCKQAGIPAYTLRETRHTFASVLSYSGVPIEQIADALGHINSQVTRTVYRHQLADEITAAATAWDGFGTHQQEAQQ